MKFKKIEAVREISKVGFVCATTSILFGFVFGEFFGTLGHGWLKPLWEDRLLITTELLILSFILGIVHVLLGLFLGMIVALKEKNMHHFVEKIGFLVFFIGILFVVNSALLLPKGIFLPVLGGLTPFSSAAIGGLIVIVSFVLLFVSAGVQGAIESISIVSNILSYARIMAIGISSVAMAKVANELAVVVGGIIGILIAITLHIVNMALGIFDPTIQALRLNYVEFFTKFYRPGGKEYAPFKKSG
jgi:V/A-type H+-transporting ATPase subunit I